MKKAIKKLSDIVGYSLIDLTDKQILVEKDGVYSVFDFETERGADCNDYSCEYTSVTGYLSLNSCSFSEYEAIKEAVITKVDYHHSQRKDEQRVVIKFFGGDYCLGAITAVAGSAIENEKYGVKVCAICDRLHFKEVLAKW